jgi:lysophospholipase L1-like esterase
LTVRDGNLEIDETTEVGQLRVWWQDTCTVNNTTLTIYAYKNWIFNPNWWGGQYGDVVEAGTGKLNWASFPPFRLPAAHKDVLYDFNLTAYDYDVEDDLDWCITETNASWLNISPNNRTCRFYGTPTSVGEYYVKIRVNDSVAPSLTSYQYRNITLYVVDPTDDTTLRVVCIGDSTVAGQSTTRQFPYWLQDYFDSNGISARVFNLGIGGDNTFHMRGHTNQSKSEDNDTHILYDTLRLDPHMVIILGGINDICSGIAHHNHSLNIMTSPYIGSGNSTTVYENLTLIFQYLRENGTAVISMKIFPPGSYAAGGSKAIERNETNEQLEAYWSDGVLILETSWILANQSGNLSYQSDTTGTHPTEAGYRLVANYTAPIIQKIWEGEVYYGVPANFSTRGGFSYTGYWNSTPTQIPMGVVTGSWVSVNVTSYTPTTSTIMSFTATGSGSAQFTISNLTDGQRYTITRDGTALGTYTASGGSITFENAVWSEHDFVISEADPTPAEQISELVPVVISMMGIVVVLGAVSAIFKPFTRLVRRT